MAGYRSQAADFIKFCEGKGIKPEDVHTLLGLLYLAKWEDVEPLVARITFPDGSSMEVDGNP